MAGREPDNWAAGNGSPGGWCADIRLFSGRPMFGVIRCGQCRWLHSSIRVFPAVAGGMGRVRVRERSGGANQMGALPPGAGAE